MSVQTTLNVSPGNTYIVPTNSGSRALKVTNKSYFDLQYSGYGTESGDWIAAGTEYLLDASTANTGKLTLQVFNSSNVTSSSGPVLISEFVIGEQLPAGHWPVTIPQSSVNNVSTLTLSTATATPPAGTGSVTVTELIVGSLKICTVIATNMQNTSASKFTLALPTAFSSWAIVLSGRTTQTELLAGGSSGTAQSLNAVTGLAAGANGSISAQTVIFQYNFVEMIGPFDTLRFQASNGTVHNNDGLLIIGV